MRTFKVEGSRNLSNKCKRGKSGREIVPITDEGATWDLFVAWQRGKTAVPVRVLIDALGRKSRTTS